MAKEEDEEKQGEKLMQILALPGSVCRRRFAGVTVGVLDVKSLVEHGGEG